MIRSQRTDAISPTGKRKDTVQAVESADTRELAKSWFQRTRRRVLVGVSLLIALILIGRSGYAPTELEALSIAQKFRGWDFNLLSWEVEAISDKVSTFVEKPTTDLTEQEAIHLVRSYLERAREIADREAALHRTAAGNGAETTIESTSSENKADLEVLRAELDQLRREQESTRLTVEAIIQEQISEVLVEEGLHIASQAFPPVLFSFTEPPKKLVVSPRDRIEIRHAKMLDAQITLEAIEESEQKISEEQNLSAYVTNIGGLGAFPTMVVDQAGLEWVLSTVAHEWTHNYLTLFPLGINYGKSHEITIINETVAEIVGNEIGHQVAQRFYPETDSPSEPPSDRASENAKDDEQLESVAESETGPSTDQESPPSFDFRKAMRETRLTVDRLLSEGEVEEAEAFMEEQRLHFVENGYNLRVLNQAYFAFHGSYGTSAASTSTIGPKLEELRSLSTDLHDFVKTVRWLTSEAEIDEAIQERRSGGR